MYHINRLKEKSYDFMIFSGKSQESYKKLTASFARLQDTKSTYKNNSFYMLIMN
jgi:hypothetical protein